MMMLSISWDKRRLAGTLRTIGLFVYYLSVIILLLWIYGRGDTPTAPFVYQGF